MAKERTTRKNTASNKTKCEDGYIREQTSSKWINKKILNDVDKDYTKK